MTVVLRCPWKWPPRPIKCVAGCMQAAWNAPLSPQLPACDRPCATGSPSGDSPRHPGAGQPGRGLRLPLREAKEAQCDRAGGLRRGPCVLPGPVSPGRMGDTHGTVTRTHAADHRVIKYVSLYFLKGHGPPSSSSRLDRAPKAVPVRPIPPMRHLVALLAFGMRAPMLPRFL